MKKRKVSSVGRTQTDIRPGSSHTPCTAEDQAMVGSAASRTHRFVCVYGGAVTPGWCAAIIQSWVDGAALMCPENPDILVIEPQEGNGCWPLFWRQSCK